MSIRVRRGRRRWPELASIARPRGQSTRYHGGRVSQDDAKGIHLFPLLLQSELSRHLMVEEEERQLNQGFIQGKGPSVGMWEDVVGMPMSRALRVVAGGRTLRRQRWSMLDGTDVLPRSNNATSGRHQCLRALFPGTEAQISPTQSVVCLNNRSRQRRKTQNAASHGHGDGLLIIGRVHIARWYRALQRDSIIGSSV